MDLIPRSWTSPPEISLITSSAANLYSVTGLDPNTTPINDARELSAKDEELFQGYSDELLKFASVTCIFFTLIGIPGNLVTIIALSRCSKARNATAIFIINLSISDFLFCCFNLPLATSTFLQRSWNHGEMLCRLFPLMRYGLLAVSLFTILLITINRYIMIGHPRIYPRIYRNRYLAIMVAATWIGAFSILIPTYRSVWGTFGLDFEIGSCSILPDKKGNSPKEFLFIIAFVIPCLCIFVCYARIFYIVRKAALRSREPAEINSSVRYGKPNTVQIENNDSDQELIEEKFKLSRDEIFESPSSISNSEVSNHGKEQMEQHSHHWQMRPYLSKLREDEIKYIDTSVESDFQPSPSVLKINGKHEGTPPGKTDSIGESGKPCLKICGTAGFDEKYSYFENSKDDSPPNDVVEAMITEVPLKTNDTSGETKTVSKRNYKSVLKTSINRVTKHKFNNNSTVNTSNASILYPGRMSKKDKRLLKMILVIFLSFVVCYLPITITKLWKGGTHMHWLNISGYLLIYLTTCINPFIYAVMSSEYRQAYWNLLRCKIGKKSPQNHRFAEVTKKASNLKNQPET